LTTSHGTTSVRQPYRPRNGRRATMRPAARIRPVVQQRVFLSAVSNDFKSAREALAHALRAAGFHVEEQDTFVQRGTAPRLLRKLHNYIEDCIAVLCLIGSRTGA